MGQQYMFSTGKIVATRSDTAGNTPIEFGTVQDVSIDVSFNKKKLYGQKQFPDDIARGQGSVTGKIKFARINGLIYNSIFFGLASQAGGDVIVLDEVGTIPAETTYTITVANGATFAEDLGVKFATGGTVLKKVASSPATGEYSVNTTTGVYTFAAADASKGVLITYSYTPASPVGLTTLITNQDTGVTPTFKLLLSKTYKGKLFAITLYACVADKLAMAMKNEDHMMQDIDFEAFGDDSGWVMRIKAAEQ